MYYLHTRKSSITKLLLRKLKLNPFHHKPAPLLKSAHEQTTILYYNKHSRIWIGFQVLPKNYMLLVVYKSSIYRFALPHSHLLSMRTTRIAFRQKHETHKCFNGAKCNITFGNIRMKRKKKKSPFPIFRTYHICNFVFILPDKKGVSFDLNCGSCKRLELLQLYFL